MLVVQDLSAKSHGPRQAQPTLLLMRLTKVARRWVHREAMRRGQARALLPHNHLGASGQATRQAMPAALPRQLPRCCPRAQVVLQRCQLLPHRCLLVEVRRQQAQLRAARALVLVLVLAGPALLASLLRHCHAQGADAARGQVAAAHLRTRAYVLIQPCKQL
jgi:hypothetical protein